MILTPKRSFHFFIAFISIYLFLLFRTAPVAYGSSQARGVELVFPGLLHEARDRTRILIDTSRIRCHCAMVGTPLLPFWFQVNNFLIFPSHFSSCSFIYSSFNNILLPSPPSIIRRKYLVICSTYNNSFLSGKWSSIYLIYSGTVIFMCKPVLVKVTWTFSLEDTWCKMNQSDHPKDLDLGIRYSLWGVNK